MVFFVAYAVAFEDIQKPFPGFVVRQVMADGRVVNKGARGFGYDNQRNRGTFELALKGGDEFNRGMPGSKSNSRHWASFPYYTG